MSILGRGFDGAPFVGRKDELSVLKSHFDRARQGSGSTLLIEGEAGVGKTALFNEFARVVGGRAARILSGKCLYKDDATPYLPFVEAFKPEKTGPVMRDTLPIGMMGFTVDEDEPREPELPVGLFSGKEHDSRVLSKDDVEKERERMFGTVLSTLNTISTHRTAIVFIDDLQWADKSSLQLLHYIARNVKSMHAMVVCAYRPEEIRTGEDEHGILDTFRRMGEEGLCTTLRLERLGKGDIAGIIGGLVAAEDIPASFIDRVYRESEGNPFFVVEVMKALAEDGVIDRKSHVWASRKDLDKIVLTTSVRDVVTRRLAKLDYSMKKILMYASVVGNQFDFQVLNKAMEMDEEELLDRLDQLIELHLVIEEPAAEGEVFRFDHVQIRQVVYDGLSRSRARIMHKRVGEIIEEVHAGKLDDMAYNLARHFFTGQVWDKGFKYSVAAGERAVSMLAFDEATEYLVQALTCLDAVDASSFPEGAHGVSKERAVICKRLGDLAYGSGRFHDGIRHYTQTLSEARKLGDEVMEAVAYCQLGISKTRISQYRDAGEDLDRALKLFSQRGDHAGIADANRGLGYIHWRGGELDEAVDHYNKTVDSAKAVGDDRLIGMTYIDLGNVYNHRGDFENALKHYTMAIEVLEGINDYSEMARAYNNIGDLNMQQEKWDTAIEYFDKCAKAAEKVGNEHLFYFSMNNAAQAMASKGDLDRAEEYANRALLLAEAADDKLTMASVHMTRGIVYRKRREFVKSVESHNKAVLIFEMLAIPYDLAQARYQLGWTYLDMGEFGEARDILETAKETLASLESRKELEIVEGLLAKIPPAA